VILLFILFIFIIINEIQLYNLSNYKDELRQRYNRRKEKARKEEWPRKRAVRKERHSRDTQQESLSSDPFFKPYSHGKAVNSGSSSGATIQESSDTIENDMNGGKNSKLSDQYNGPKTVWGTPAVSFTNVTKEKNSIEDGFDEDLLDLPEEEIYVGKKQKKKKLVLMSTGGKRQR